MALFSISSCSAIRSVFLLEVRGRGMRFLQQRHRDQHRQRFDLRDDEDLRGVEYRPDFLLLIIMRRMKATKTRPRPAERPITISSEELSACTVLRPEPPV
mmetsp:Transcript_31237/g.36647  ORF Transcript_31237/g.36647 Transcript_31237/m.36647 type:complete len:100 (+) Transcript_31237:803-1102(+)